MTARRPLVPRTTARGLARRLAQQLGWLPVLGPGAVPDCPPGWRTGPPDFVGVGVQKAGTTWWYSLIEAHPQVVVRAKKELQFFADFWRQPFRDDDIARYHRYFPRPEGSLSGEWTPRYMSDFWTPSLLERCAPESKILVLLRDPIARYVSGLTVSLGGGMAPFHPAVAQDAMARGFYFDQLSHVLESFPREQVLVLQYEICKRNVLSELARTYRFLGLDSTFVPPEAGRVINPTQQKVHVPEETAERLRALYRRDVLRLAEAFPEIDVSLWPSFAELVQ
jgi:Sulfotransferase domain